MERIGCRQSNLGHHGDHSSSVVPKLQEMGQWFTRVKRKWILGGESTVIPGLGITLGLLRNLTISLLWGASSFHLVWLCSQSPEKTHRIMGSLEHQTARIVSPVMAGCHFLQPSFFMYEIFWKRSTNLIRQKLWGSGTNLVWDFCKCKLKYLVLM